jgi:predicted TIM-barrel fold metal-dependent hydrolase
MFDGRPVIDADSHKCENPLVFADYIDAPFRHRFRVVRDRYGEQRFEILDRDPHTGRPDFARLFLQPDGYGKGTYRPFHPESTIGGLFNRVRLEHMDREGIDHQLVYGSVTLAFSSLVDAELGVALCRAYNDYVYEDCLPHRRRLHPVGTLPLQDVSAAVEEMHRCVERLGMPAVTITPNLPRPHPDAPEAFPRVRVPKPLSDPSFFPLYEAAESLGIGIGIHGAPGVQLAGGTSDQLDTFTLVHVFANRSMQQMALAKLIFDGVMERFPSLRFGFLEAGAGWLPDLMHSLSEHWEKRIVRFDPTLQPSAAEFVREFARERSPRGGRGLVRKARQLMSVILSTAPPDRVGRDELEAFWYEHPELPRDPWEYVERGQVFLSVEPDDPAPAWLPAAMGDAGRRVCVLAVDYGHWDATVEDCVGRIARSDALDADQKAAVLSGNALAFYGERLRRRIHPPRRIRPPLEARA